MARTHVTICLPDGKRFHARTDLHGRGSVKAGEVFTVREVWNFARGTRLMTAGRQLKVKAVRVEGSRCPVVHVEVLQVIA